MENDPFIDGLPINSMVIFHGELLVITSWYIYEPTTIDSFLQVVFGSGSTGNASLLFGQQQWSSLCGPRRGVGQGAQGAQWPAQKPEMYDIYYLNTLEPIQLEYHVVFPLGILGL